MQMERSSRHLVFGSAPSADALKGSRIWVAGDLDFKLRSGPTPLVQFWSDGPVGCGAGNAGRTRVTLRRVWPQGRRESEKHPRVVWPRHLHPEASEQIAFVASSGAMDEQRETSPTEVDIHTTRAAMLASLNHRKQLASLLAGGFAGTFASTITCPLEVIKTKLQSISAVQNGGKHATFISVTTNIARQEGFRGFFRGLLPTWIGILPARATYFWAYSTTKSVLSNVFGESDARTHITSAAMAGIVSNALTNPIWMVKTRMQLDVGGSNAFHYRGYGDACRRILAEEGIAGFYKGLTASFWGVSEGAIHFLFYERLKGWLQRKRRAKLGKEVTGHEADELPSAQYLIAAGFSKLIASTLTYPHEVVRTRLREQRPMLPSGQLKYRSVPHALWVIGREEGRRGLYSGMGTHLLRVVPNTALMFLAYELVSRWIEKYYAQRDEDHSTKAAQASSS
ncbi:hypothetical protein CCYA_CCYA09G2666 [Cyanidiococcus yangmingshanensis]|nr:hypothetical protein CCYA_CCYA09G2666 [Cyanidiococcus yangmingshanensis]